MVVSVVCMASACGPAATTGTSAGDGTDGTGSSTGSPTTSAGTVATTAPTSADATGTGTTSPSTDPTLDPADTSTTEACPEEDVKFDLGVAHECDIFEQDCERGQKCVGDGYYVRVCVPIDPAPLADGEPCEEARGVDPCALGSECVLDAGGGAGGVCRPQCAGSFGSPECPDGTLCVIDDNEAVAYCDRPCEPLDPAACVGFACVATQRGFACLPPGDATAAERCTGEESCNRDLACQLAEDVEGCCSNACCTPFCDAEHPCVIGDCIAIDPPLAGGEGVGWCRTT